MGIGCGVAGTGSAQRPAAAVAALLLAAGATGCDSLAAPEVLTGGPPQLEVLEILPVWMRDNGIVYVHAAPILHEYRIPIGEYTLATVTSTAGEFEQIRLRRQFCGPETSQQPVCGMFVITLRPGYDLRAFEGQVLAEQARLTFLSAPSSYRFGSGYAFSDWQTTVNRLRARPGVQDIEAYYFLSTGQASGYAPRAAWLAGALPYRIGDPRPRDGVVSARPGDTLVVNYVQPAQGILEARLVLQ